MMLIRYIVCRMNQTLDKRGAEMVEYAIVLACIAAIGIYFYSADAPMGTTHMKFSVVLAHLWEKVAIVINQIK